MARVTKPMWSSLQMSFLLGAALSAQEPAVTTAGAWQRTPNGHALRAIEVPQTDAVAIAVVWPWRPLVDGGAQRALEHALAMQRAVNADAVLPAGATTQRELGDGFTVFSVVLRSASPTTAASWLEALLRPFGDCSTDTLARTLALAALAADDADWLYPGEVLHGLARRAVFAATSRATGVLGDASSLQRCGTAAFVTASALPLSAPLRVCTVGEASVGARLWLVLANVAAGPTPATIEAANWRHDGTLPIALEPHPRIDAAYVAAALRLPVPSDDSLSAAAAIELLRLRARTRFQSWRGNESLARAPFVQADFLLGDPLVMLFRRAPAEGGPEVPRRELESLLASYETTPPTAGEIAAALAVVRAELAVPPFATTLSQALSRVPASLLPRARAACLLGHFGIADAAVHALAEVDGKGLTAALLSLLDAGVWLGGLIPNTKPPLGG